MKVTTSMGSSPTKKRRVDASKPDTSGIHNHSSSSSYRSRHSLAETWRWTLTKAATSACFVRDIHEMKESGSKDHDFYWLGSVPCRTVKLVGILVGVQRYEKRVVYTLDDGTSTIDCIHRHDPPPPPSPAKLKPTSKGKGKERANPYKRPPSPKPEKKVQIDFVPESPAPIADVGATIRVVGRVLVRHGSRQIHVDHIEVCKSVNEEIHHWMEVSILHKEKYSRADPFEIPTSAIPATLSTQVIHDTQLTNGTQDIPPASADVPTTPSRRIPSTAITPPTSSSSSVAGSSPVKSECENQDPPRLRHPSRLRSKDLTLNTFRIYVKHYMDNAPSPIPSPHRCLVCGPTEYCPHLDRPSTPILAGLREDSFDTPTAPTEFSSIGSNGFGEKTPRASTRHNIGEDTIATPQGTIHCRPISRTEGAVQQTQWGFTLSYLRRLPELSLLAKRTVEAEAKRRRRQERHDAKQPSSSYQHGARPTQLRCQPETADDRKRAGGGEPVGRKMKRLFVVTILKLYEEGSIVLWDGPVRPFAASRADSNESQGLWRSTASAASSVLSSASASIGGATEDGLRGDEEDDHDDREGDLSDAPLNEEAYMPVGARLLSEYVEDAIERLMERSLATAKNVLSGRQGSAVYRPRAVAQPGPTKEEIMRFLKKGDERWAKLGQWAIEDTLKLLKKEGRAWDVGGGRWELCM